MVSWMSSDLPLARRSRLIVKHTSRTVKAIVTDLHYRIDVNTLHRDEAATQLGLNEIGRVRLRLTQPIFCDPYTRNRTTGGLILIAPSGAFALARTTRTMSWSICGAGGTDAGI